MRDARPLTADRPNISGDPRTHLGQHKTKTKINRAKRTGCSARALHQGALNRPFALASRRTEIRTVRLPRSLLLLLFYEMPA